MSAIFDRIDNVLFQKTVRLLILGLNDTGKTTLINMFMEHRLSMYPPTISPLENSFEFKDIIFNCTEFGGFSEREWRWNRIKGADAVVFLLNAVDNASYPEVQRELEIVRSRLGSKPLLILGNKIDRLREDRSLSPEELAKRIHVKLVNHSKFRSLVVDDSEYLSVGLCSLVHRQGSQDGFLWLANIFSSFGGPVVSSGRRLRWPAFALIYIGICVLAVVVARLVYMYNNDIGR